VRVASVTLVSPRPQSKHLVLLQAERRARLAPRRGGQVSALLVAEQAVVVEGQPLVRFADDDPRGAMMSAQAAIRRIRAQIADAERELRDSRSLQTQGAENRRNVERLETQLQTYEAQLAEAQGQLLRAKDGIGAAAVEAPFAGTITTVDVELGEYVNPGQLVMTLSDLDRLALELPLTEAEVALHDAGGLEFAARVRGNTVPLALEWLAREATPGTSSFTARLLVDNPAGQLRAGESAEVEVFAAAQPKVPAVPATAIRWLGPEAFVFVVLDGKLARRPVRALDDVGELVIVEGGLAAGDVVVAAGPVNLGEGREVVVVEPDAQAGSDTVAAR
jgi:multidrug efflux system membrane fusion protein